MKSNSLESYFIRHFGRMGYIGWTGNSNLGDEILLQAFQKLHTKDSPWWPQSFRSKLLHKIIGRDRFFRSGFLGGGTLIFSKAINALEDWKHYGIPLFTFGTGVRDPEFWKVQCNTKEKLNNFYALEKRWLNLLPRFESISVRGKKSFEILSSFGIKSEIIGDPALLFASETAPSFPRNKIIGLNIGVCEGNVWGGDENVILDVITKTIKFLSSKGWRFHVICIHDRDLSISQKIASCCGNSLIKKEDVYHSPYRYIEIAQRCDVILSTKLHAGILGFASYVPTLLIEYRPKCRDFMATCESDDRCFRCDLIEPEELVNAIEKAYGDAERISSMQREVCQEFIGKITQFSKNVEIQLMEIGR